MSNKTQEINWKSIKFVEVSPEESLKDVIPLKLNDDIVMGKSKIVVDVIVK